MSDHAAAAAAHSYDRTRQTRGLTVTSELRTPNDQNFYEVTREELPVHCPLPGTSLWNSHPRVYLPIEATGEAKCGYCGAEYRLVRVAGGHSDPGRS